MNSNVMETLRDAQAMLAEGRLGEAAALCGTTAATVRRQQKLVAYAASLLKLADDLRAARKPAEITQADTDLRTIIGTLNNALMKLGPEERPDSDNFAVAPMEYDDDELPHDGDMASTSPEDAPARRRPTLEPEFDVEPDPDNNSEIFKIRKPGEVREGDELPGVRMSLEDLRQMNEDQDNDSSTETPSPRGGSAAELVEKARERQAERDRQSRTPSSPPTEAPPPGVATPNIGPPGISDEADPTPLAPPIVTPRPTGPKPVVVTQTKGEGVEKAKRADKAMAITEPGSSLRVSSPPTDRVGEGALHAPSPPAVQTVNVPPPLVEVVPMPPLSEETTAPVLPPLGEVTVPGGTPVPVGRQDFGEFADTWMAKGEGQKNIGRRLLSFAAMLVVIGICSGVIGTSAVVGWQMRDSAPETAPQLVNASPPPVPVPAPSPVLPPPPTPPQAGGETTVDEPAPDPVREVEPPAPKPATQAPSSSPITGGESIDSPPVMEGSGEASDYKVSGTIPCRGPGVQLFPNRAMISLRESGGASMYILQGSFAPGTNGACTFMKGPLSGKPVDVACLKTSTASTCPPVEKI